MVSYIATDNAPKAVGAYSQGVVAGGFLFTAGQIALTPDGTLLKADAALQTRQIMTNLIAILEASGCTLDDVVKSQIFIVDKNLFAEVNNVYSQFFKTDKVPARECLVAMPPLDGALVEISMIAVVSS